MSGITSGSVTGGYENLSALLEFVKSPERVERIKELRDQEVASIAAHEQAQASIRDADEKATTLAADKAKYEVAAQKLADDQAAHAAKVARWAKAVDHMQRALHGED